MAVTQAKAWGRGLVLLALAVGCGTFALQRAQSQPPPGKTSATDGQVIITNPLTTDTVVTQTYLCKVASQEHIAICPQASGYLQEIAVKEGQAVKKGDVLFKILPTIYQAKLDIELAEVKIAQIEFDNTNDLFNRKVVSAHELALSAAKLARAQAKAKVAETELSFTIVRAPFDGMIGRILVQPGSLAKTGENLTTLTDNSVMRGYFHVAEVQYLEYMAKSEEEREAAQVELRLVNGKKLRAISMLTPIEAQSDTGTIVFRADFPNPDRLLLHGQTAVVLVQQPLHDALVIPQRSTVEINDSRVVYLVGKDGIVRAKPITVLRETDDYFVIKDGLDPKDHIVVDGLTKLRLGEKVNGEFRKPEEVMPNVKKPE